MLVVQILNRWSGNAIIGGDYETLVELIKSHPGADLTGADLTGANLTEANLSKANLTGADLPKANLTEANLSKANLTGADLTGADLTEANLSKANLSGADLSGADLDFASWPIWCYSLTVKLDDRLKAQFLYHALRMAGESVAIPDEMKQFVNTNFHKVIDGTCRPLTYEVLP